MTQSQACRRPSLPLPSRWGRRFRTQRTRGFQEGFLGPLASSLSCVADRADMDTSGQRACTSVCPPGGLVQPSRAPRHRGCGEGPYRAAGCPLSFPASSSRCWFFRRLLLGVKSKSQTGTSMTSTSLVDGLQFRKLQCYLSSCSLATGPLCYLSLEFSPQRQLTGTATLQTSGHYTGLGVPGWAGSTETAGSWPSHSSALWQPMSFVFCEIGTHSLLHGEHGIICANVKNHAKMSCNQAVWKDSLLEESRAQNETILSHCGTPSSLSLPRVDRAWEAGQLL